MGDRDLLYNPPQGGCPRSFLMLIWAELMRPDALYRATGREDVAHGPAFRPETLGWSLVFRLVGVPSIVRALLSREAEKIGCDFVWPGREEEGGILYGAPSALSRLALLLLALPESEARASGESLRRALEGVSVRKWTLPLPRGRELHLGGRTLVMGILNLTDDSFYDGSRVSGAACVERARAMIEEGADILDLGAESTRPGSKPVTAEEEISRLVPGLTAIRELFPDAVLSVDTTKAAVARACVSAGADMVNDISGLGFDPEMAPIIAELGVPLVIMHIAGTPETMQQNPQYGNLPAEIASFFEERISRAEAAGVSREMIILDPGIGFGKTKEHNMTLLRHPEFFRPFGRPVLVGHSRKSSFGQILRLPDPKDRLESTLAVSALCAWQGVEILRVHDVRENVRAVRTAEAVRDLGEIV